MDSPGFLPLRAAAPDLLAEALALNAAVAHWTSPLDSPALRRLLEASAFAEAAVDGDRAAALIIGFDERSAYDSPNFLWFRDRLPRFAYVDRVVTAPWAQGRGLARALYARFAAWATAQGQHRLACEVDAGNPGSDAFHARLGFEAIGRGEPRPGKAVRYLVRELPL